MRVAVLFVSSIALLPSCTSSDPASSPAPSDSASESAPATCALVAGSCTASAGMCCGQIGTLFDETRNCLTKTRATIGCAPTPLPPGGACVDLGVVGCAITAEGGVRRVWFTASRAVGWEGSEGCGDALAAKVTSAAPCVDDAGP